MSAHLTLLLLTTAFVGSAHAAPSWWQPLPLEAPSGLRDDTYAAIDKAPLRPDLFEPLWAERSHLAQMTAAFGAPDQSDNEGSIWYFDSLVVRIQEARPGYTIIEIGRWDEPNPRSFDPSRVAFGAYIAAVQGCQAALTAFGRPSQASGDHTFSWMTLGRGRDASLLVGCDGHHSIARIGLTQLSADELTALQRARTPATLPKAFTPAQADKATPIDPRPLWPRGIAPGQSMHTVVAAVGPPSRLDPETQTAWWGKSLSVTFSDGGLVTRVSVDSHGAELSKRLALSTPLLPAIAAPLEHLTKVLGRPVKGDGEASWYWDEAEHELSITAALRGGRVTSLQLEWQPPAALDDLECGAALVSGPTQSPPALSYVSPITKRSVTRLVPFGLWFGAHPRDVLDRLGPPRSCAIDELRYRGFVAMFVGGKLERVSLISDLLPQRLRRLDDPLVALVAAGDDALRDAFGVGGDFMSGRLFERGAEQVRVRLSSDLPRYEGATAYAASVELGFDFARIEGLDFANLAASANALNAPTVLITEESLVTRVHIPMTAKAELAGRVSGPFIDLLGARWTTIVSTLGNPTNASATATEVILEWSRPNDPLDRVIAYRCSGEAPTCHTLVVGAKPMP